MCDIYLSDKSLESLLNAFCLEDCNGDLVVSKFYGLNTYKTEYHSFDVRVIIKNYIGEIFYDGSLVNFVKSKAYEELDVFSNFEIKDGILYIYLF